MDFKEQLRQSINIVKVVGEFVRLRKAGSRWVGLCPFHQEKSPSFGVNETYQAYKCFGCGASGDVFKFVMETEGVSFFEAMTLLAERNGIQMPKRRDYTDPQLEKRTALMEMHELALQNFAKLLRAGAGQEAMGYLARRGVSEEMIQTFGLGYADSSLRRQLEAKGYPREWMEASGLVGKRENGELYDRFRHRLMFPIHNETGKPIGFGGRSLNDTDQPKYLNSPATDIYDKSAVLYNLNRAKKAIRDREFSILVEGYMDVIGVYAAGFQNVVASCGTALTVGQVRALKRHSEKVVANFDPDNAGAKATEKSIALFLEEGFHVRVLSLPDGLDPDEYIKAHGAEAYQRQLESAEGFFHWLAARARTKFDMRSAEGRMEGFKQMLLPQIMRIPEKLERLAIVNEIAAYLGVDPQVIRDQFRQQSVAPHRAARPAVDPRMARVSPAERTLLAAVFTEEHRGLILDFLREHQGLDGLATQALFRAILSTVEAGAAPGYGEVESRLEKEDRDLLASLLLSDKTPESLTETGFSREQVESCLAALDQMWRRAALAEYDRQIKNAERVGNMPEVLRLYALRRELEQKRWRRGPDAADKK